MNFNIELPVDLVNFIIVLTLSLLIGLSQRKHFQDQDSNQIFGSDRTYSLIGILGYVLYVIHPDNMVPYLVGAGFVIMLIGMFYAYKLFYKHVAGVTSLLISMLCYSLAPLIYLKALWITITVVVSILILNEMKESFINFTKKINDMEFINLGKFLIIAGVILPILPHDEIIKGLSLSPYNIWLTTVVISGFSYISYLLKRYVLNKSGILVSGFIGGLYSSTATCVILAKKAETASEENLGQYVTAIFCAISTCYIKYLVLMSVFNTDLLLNYWHIFVIMFFVALGVAAYFYFKTKEKKTAEQTELQEDEEDKNPLEFKVALLFAALFIIFTILTSFVLQKFGTSGLSTLSILVGVTDITPFVLNLFQSESSLTAGIVMIATFQAIISNNLVKMIYGIFLSKKRIIKQLLAGFSIIAVVNILLLAFLI